jgi:hypothetical protein
MTAPANSDGTKTSVGEEVQEVLIPTPRSMASTVNKKQRHRMSITARPLVDHLEH